MRATADRDLETVLSLIAEDAVFLLPDQPPMRGREAFAAALRSALGQVRIEGSRILRRFMSLETRESAFSDGDSNSLVRRCLSYGKRRADAGFSFAMPTCLERLGAPVLDSRTEPHSI